MKFVKNVAAALHLSAFGDAGGTSTGAGAVSWGVLLYKGAVPTLAEFTAAMNSPNFLNATTTNREPYQNFQDLLVARDADYLGVVSGRSIPDVAKVSSGKIELKLNNAALGAVALAAGQSGRLSYFNQDGTPTWFAFVLCNGAYIVANSASPMAGNASNVVFGCLGTVGDETSSADLRIKGGKVYSNSASPTDQSKSVNISNLILTFN